jgi:hypothetical protein
MSMIKAFIKEGLLKEVKKSSDVKSLRVAEFIFINDTHEVVGLGQSRCPQSYIDGFFSRCRGKKIDRNSFLSFSRFTEHTTKHSWRVYAIANNKFGNNSVIRNILRETKYTLLGRLEKYKSVELQPSNYSMFKVTCGDSPLVRFIHARSTTDHSVIITRVMANLRSGKSSLRGNDVNIRLNPKWLEIREAFMNSSKLTVTRMEDHEYNLEKIKNATAVTRDLNRKALIEAK